jgi:hypothetical protein
MKTTLLLATLATGFLLPAITHADAPATKTKRINNAIVMKPAATKQPETYYISKTAATGSHIPTVFRAYEGRMDTPSNLRVYSQKDLNRSGELDVASELSLVDTSITTGRVR